MAGAAAACTLLFASAAYSFFLRRINRSLSRPETGNGLRITRFILFGLVAEPASREGPIRNRLLLLLRRTEKILESSATRSHRSSLGLHFTPSPCRRCAWSVSLFCFKGPRDRSLPLPYRPLQNVRYFYLRFKAGPLATSAWPPPAIVPTIIRARLPLPWVVGAATTTFGVFRIKRPCGRAGPEASSIAAMRRRTS